MNGLTTAKFRFLALLACIVVVFGTGCKKESADPAGSPLDQASSNGEDHPIQPAITAETILENLIETYASASSYQDRGVLYLDYRMDGRNIQEPQPWSAAWDRNGRLAAQLFNAQIRCDANLLSCYVFDIETANLDNQHLLIPYDSQLPLGQLYRDPIARHFIGGYSELPLDESDQLSLPKLIPPTISLLTRQTDCSWIQTPSQAERLADESVDGVPCYVVRCLSENTTADIWVDKKTFLLVQMSLPLKLLAGEVITSPEITDVVLLARFHDATINASVTDDLFAIPQRSDATPVRKYVELPPAFPSELIGQSAPQFQLTTPEGKIRTKLYFDGKVTAFLWLAGRSSFTAIGQLDALANQLEADKFYVASIYSDSELKSPGTPSLEVVDELANSIKASSLDSYYDRELQASTSLGVKAIPSVIVIDGDSNIQFARALSDKNWAKDVKAAMQRVAAGDDVAKEMQAEYQRFLGSYHQQLLTVSAADLIAKPGPSLETDGPPSALQRASVRVRPEQTWVNREFKKPGNIVTINNELGEARLFVLDGFRTVIELGPTGQTLARHELSLPDGEAVNLIRAYWQGQNRVFAVFSALGKQVYLFDQAWRPVTRYPESDVKHAGIRDCQFSDLDSNGAPELLVGFDDDHGVHLVNPASSQGVQISASMAMSLANFGDDPVISSQGKIGRLKLGLDDLEQTELAFRRVVAIGDSQLCGLGVSDNGNWNAVGFDDSLNRIWTLAVGSQFFESQIEPIAVTESSGESIWAIADVDDVIHLVSGSGKWLGDFHSESRLGGLGLTSVSGQTSLIVSNATGVECWNLNLQSSPMRPVSTKK